MTTHATALTGAQGLPQAAPVESADGGCKTCKHARQAMHQEPCSRCTVGSGEGGGHSNKWVAARVWAYEVMSCGGEWIPETKMHEPPDIDLFVIRNLREVAPSTPHAMASDREPEMGAKTAGYGEGDQCGRGGCVGVIDTHPSENCSCHISPPCSACTAPRAFCPVCDWHEANEVVINDFVVQVNPATGNYQRWEPRPLDPTKIDWRSREHTHFSMIKEGVYPEGTTLQQVEEKVRGTFGGRFTSFKDGHFKYIAYTD